MYIQTLAFVNMSNGNYVTKQFYMFTLMDVSANSQILQAYIQIQFQDYDKDLNQYSY